MENKLSKENPKKQNWYDKLKDKTIIQAKTKAENEIDKLYKEITNDINNPWYYAQAKGLKKVKEKIAVPDIETSVGAGIIFLVFGIGCFIGLGFLIAHLFSINDVDSLDMALLSIIVTPFVFAEIPILILGIACITASIKFIYIKEPTATLPTKDEALDLMEQGKAEYFGIPFEKYTNYTDDKLRNLIINASGKIHYGEDYVGDEFWDYVRHQKEVAEKKRKENERIRKEVTKMQMDNPKMYEYLFGDYDWDNPEPAPPIKHIPKPQPQFHPQPQVVYVTKEVTKEIIKEKPTKPSYDPHKHKGLYGGGINGDMTMCLNCSKTTCSRVICSGFNPKKN